MGGFEQGAGGIMGRSLMDMSVTVACWACMFGTEGFATSAAHRPADVEKCFLQKGGKLCCLFVVSSV